MVSFDSQSTSQLLKSTFFKRLLIFLVILAAFYAFGCLYILYKKEESSTQLETEKVKAINTDLKKLSGDIEADKKNLEEKELLIQKIQKNLDDLKKEADMSDSKNKMSITELKARLQELSIEKSDIQNSLDYANKQYAKKEKELLDIIKGQSAKIKEQDERIQTLEGSLIEHKKTIKNLQIDLEASEEVIESLEDKIKVEIKKVGFYANGWDDVDNDLDDTRRKKKITEVGLFYNLSRDIKANEVLILECIVQGNSIGKREYRKADLEELVKSSNERPLSLKITEGTFDVPMKINIYIKVGSKEIVYLIDSKVIPSVRIKKPI